MFLDPKAGANCSFIGFSLSLIVAFVVALILTFIWGDVVVDDESTTQVKKVEFKDEVVASPLKGTAVELKMLFFQPKQLGKELQLVRQKEKWKCHLTEKSFLSFQQNMQLV